MLERAFKESAHLVRVAGLFAVGIVGFVGARMALVPKGFGTYGHYRAGALEDNRARPAAFAGRDTCEVCHSDVAEARKGAKHERIGCEACHGAQARHANAEDPATAKPQRPDAQVCLVCHTANVAKPRGFPQIDPRQHEKPGTCLACHVAHRPGDAPKGAPAP
jgi:hypothetical protein